MQKNILPQKHIFQDSKFLFSINDPLSTLYSPVLSIQCY